MHLIFPHSSPTIDLSFVPSIDVLVFDTEGRQRQNGEHMVPIVEYPSYSDASRLHVRAATTTQKAKLRPWPVR